MAYTHLLLDLDGTLFDFQAAQQNAFYRTMESLEVVANAEMLARYDEINHSMWKLLEQGQIAKAEMLPQRFALLFSDYGIVRNEHLTNKLYQENLATGDMLLDGAVQTMELLQGRYVLAAVTNGVAWSQRNRLAKSGLGKFFDKLFISEELGCEKPELCFFEQVFSAYANIDKKNMLLVGDSLTADIQGGLNAAIDTCWMNSRQEQAAVIAPKYHITTISELPLLLGGEEKQYVYQGKSHATVSE